MTKKNYQQLSESERHAIALGLQQRQSLSAIARALGRSKSTISRECTRNGGGNGYVSKFAQQRSDRRRRLARPSPKLHRNAALFSIGREYLRLHWSPQQHRGAVEKTAPRQQAPTRVTQEHLHLHLCPAPGESSKKSWSRACAWRAPSAGPAPGEDRRGQITERLSIHVRPPEIEDRQLPGHWDGDLIKGKGNASAIGTLVERTTRLVVLVRLAHPQPGDYRPCAAEAFSDKLNGIAAPCGSA